MFKLIPFLAILGCSEKPSAVRDQEKGSAPINPTKAAKPVEDMIDIPTGEYSWVTRSCENEADREQTNRAFQIDRDTVTCDQYQECVAARQCRSYGRDKCMRHAATVPLEGASEYCAWRGAEVASSGQWQKAARKDGRPFPAGQVADFDRTCSTSAADPGMRCLYTSPFGMKVQMLGPNEWTRDKSCHDDQHGPEQPLAVRLDERLDELVVPSDPYNKFRCVRLR